MPCIGPKAHYNAVCQVHNHKGCLSSGHTGTAWVGVQHSMQLTNQNDLLSHLPRSTQATNNTAATYKAFSTGRPWQLSAINHYHKQAWYKISSPFREGVCKWVPSLPVRLRWWQSTPQLDRIYDASAGGTLCICSVVWGASSIASCFEWSGWQC
jgi:hypothetical protein